MISRPGSQKSEVRSQTTEVRPPTTDLRLWRLDASFETDAGEQPGVFTLIELDELCARHDAAQLARLGWDVDVYDESPELSDDELARLVGRPWPQLPLAELLALASSPLADALNQLDRIKARRGPHGSHL